MRYVALLVVGFAALCWAEAPKDGKTEIKPKTTFTIRTEKAIKDFNYDKKTASEMRKWAKQYDEKITAYLKQKQISEEFAQTMYAGNVEVGMHIEQVELYSEMRRDSETENMKTVVMLPWSPAMHNPGTEVYYVLTASKDGEIVKVERPRGADFEKRSGVAMESCETCERAIGKLETPRVFKGSVVCAKCWEVLSLEIGDQQNDELDNIVTAESASPANDKQCPSCKSDNTAAVSVVYARETGTKNFGGVGLSLDGDVTSFGGTARSVTDFAAKLAPTLEQPPSSFWIALTITMWLGCGLAFISFIDTLGHVNRDTAANRFSAATAFVLCLFFALWSSRTHRAKRVAWTFAERRNIATMAKWKRTWVCLRCGHRWII